MAGLRSNGADRRQGRRWSFATCIFDENSWSLFVDGCRVPIEAKPLELLQELLLRPSEVVSKDELFDKIWPNVTVVEASLPTAVHKLRLAIGDDAHRHIIETVASIGYRLGVPVEIEYSPASPEPSAAIGTAAQNAVIQTLRSKFASVRFLSIAGGLGIAAAVSAFALGPAPRGSANKAPAQFSKRDVKSAVRKLDVDTIEKMLAAGWDPNMPLDAEDNGALNIVLGVCEWDRTRDAARMVLMVRTLIEGGAKLDHRNVWGDTPYSIAKAPRYCGPSHPVTKSIRATCFDGYKPLGDRCLASYERPRSPQPLRSKSHS